MLTFQFFTKTESMTDREQPVDWDHFHILLEQLLKRVPSLRDASLERLCNGPEAFSPDCKWILGESPEVRGLNLTTGTGTLKATIFFRFKTILLPLE